jgi:lipid-A-disaccharide synthase
VRVAISAVEVSGLELAALLGRELAALGDVVLLRSPAGVGPVFGFVEGLRSTARAARALGRSVAELGRLRPDVLVAIGLPGFHLALGRRCRDMGIPVLLMVPPQFWAWGRGRVRVLQRSADCVVCVFAFEETALRRAGVNAHYFGYPLLDAVSVGESRERTMSRLGLAGSGEYVVFLPGSRPAEVRFHVPLFRQVFCRLRARCPVLGGVMVAEAASGLDADPMVWTREGRYDVMAHAACAVVCSGTATAEAAILGVPMVVTYHLDGLTRLLARLLARVESFSIPNLVAGQKLVPELLEPTPGRLARQVERLLGDPARREWQRAGLERVRERLGPAGAMSSVARQVAELAGRSGPIP